MPRSVWHTAVAAMRTVTASGPAGGSIRSRIRNWRGDSRTAACMRDRPECLVSRTKFSTARRRSARQRRIAGHRIDDADLLDREVRNQLDAILVHDQHLFNAHAPLQHLAVLGF